MEEWKCDLCKLEFTSESMLRSHEMGKVQSPVWHLEHE
ncbi:MAG: hypothetical protein GY739_21710 [Mesoflavibacter sp.]|nr:hypothetical protein [Mesoflavibacter sp.]